MNNRQTETSRMIAVEHVTLDKATHKTTYELAPVRDVVLASLDNDDDECTQCGMPIADSQSGRTDLLCEYCASQ